MQQVVLLLCFHTAGSRTSYFRFRRCVRTSYSRRLLIFQIHGTRCWTDGIIQPTRRTPRRTRRREPSDRRLFL